MIASAMGTIVQRQIGMINPEATLMECNRRSLVEP
jgi:hypothetical protein